jgi:hypothetical protein
MSCILHNLGCKIYFSDSQDNYFFELLYEMWRERFPESTKTLEDIKDVVTDGGRLVAPLAAVSVPTQEKETEKEEEEEALTSVKQEESDEIKENCDEDPKAANVDEAQDKAMTAEEKVACPTAAIVTDGGGDDSLKDEVRLYTTLNTNVFFLTDIARHNLVLGNLYFKIPKIL